MPHPEIEALRKRIDELDLELVALLNERAECARRIGLRKDEGDRAVYAPARERQIMQKVTAASRGPLPDSALQAIFREVISACRSMERPLTVAYWGPPASNTHVAARERFGSQVEYLQRDSLDQVFDEVRSQRADFGVVPVENSTEGVVAHSLDLFLESDLQICSEVRLPIHHNLLSRAERLDQVRRVYTMYQATSQCRNWLQKNLPGVELVDANTTARGAALAAEDPEAGAIANLAAAKLYGLNVLAENIEDNPRNGTRFWVIGRLQPPPSGHDKTSLLFAVPHQPGALVAALNVFAEHGVTLTFIESRPTRQNPWEYVFFVDTPGHVGDGPEAPLVKALEALKQHTLLLRVLGSYPEAE